MSKNVIKFYLTISESICLNSTSAHYLNMQNAVKIDKRGFFNVFV